MSGDYRNHHFKLDFGYLGYRFLRSSRLHVRLTILVQNSIGVQFRLDGGFLENFKKIIRFRSLQTGDRLFDQQFSLTGEPEKLVLKLFANDKIRRELRDARMRIGGISVKLHEQVLICEPQFLSFIGANFKYASKAVMNVLDASSEIADAVNKLEEVKDGD